MRYAEIPEIQTELLQADNRGVGPTGIGEVSVPATAPALANAVFNATGQRYRKLPLGLTVRRVRTEPVVPAPAPTPAPASVDPELTAAAQASLAANCGECHDPPSDAGGIGNISDMDVLQKSRGLRKRFQRIIGKSMPPPVVQNGVEVSPISAVDRKAIFDWIEAVNSLPGPGG